MVRQNVSDEALRQLDFDARDIMEAEAKKIDLALIIAYQETQVSIANKLRAFNNRFPRGTNFDMASVQTRFRQLKRQIDQEIEALGNTTERLTLQAKRVGVDKARLVTTSSAGLIAAGAVRWAEYLQDNARPYINSGLLLEKYPRSVRTYKDLLMFFDRQDFKYFDTLKFLPGFKDRLAISRFNLGDISRLTDLSWSPLEELRRIFRTADVERLSYGQLVTTIRRDVWHLPPGSRTPRVTSQATRLARTEMVYSAATAQNSWAWQTPGIEGVRRWFGGGACDGSCLQYVGYWRFDREGHPEPIPIHPHCGCYETFETERRAEQQTQEVMLLENGRYMDSMTYRHDSVLAARVGEDLPGIAQRYTLQGSGSYTRPLSRRSGALQRNLDRRLTPIS
jgi:hypothetical protein